MIRVANVNDIPAIAVLYREQFKEMAELQPYFIQEEDQSAEFILNSISDNDSAILIYEEENNIVGFILLQAKTRPAFPFIVQGKYCYIMDIIITQNSRGKGFGTALMKAAKDWAKERGCNFINLDVFENNADAIALYKKLGFVTKAQEMYCKL